MQRNSLSRLAVSLRPGTCRRFRHHVHEAVVVEMRAGSNALRQIVDQIGEAGLVGVHTSGLQERTLLQRQIRRQAKRPVHRRLPIAERLVWEDLRLFALLEVEERVADRDGCRRRRVRRSSYPGSCAAA